MTPRALAESPPPPARRRSIRRWVIWGLVIVACAAVGLLAAGTLLARGAPDAYVRLRSAVRAMSPEQLRQQARGAEDQLLRAREFALANWAAEGDNKHRGGLPIALPPAGTSDTIVLTDTQLNALAAKWAESSAESSPHAAEVASALSRYLEDPTVILQKDRLILAGALRGYGGAVASLVFAPKLDDAGQLHVDLVDVKLGSLPMPEALYGPQRDKAIARLNESLPVWQDNAALAPAGTANLSATKAWWGELLEAALQGRPVPPTIFIPVLGRPGGSLPTKLAGLAIDDGKLTLTIQPLDAAARQAAVERVRQPIAAPTPAP